MLTRCKLTLAFFMILKSFSWSICSAEDNEALVIGMSLAGMESFIFTQRNDAVFGFS